MRLASIIVLLPGVSLLIGCAFDTLPAPPLVTAVSPSGMVTGSPGEELVMEATYDGAPTSWTWIFTGGVTLLDETPGSTAHVRLDALGVIAGSVTASNDQGESSTFHFSFSVARPPGSPPLFASVASWGGPSEDEATAVVVDELGNVLVAGRFARVVNFNPGGPGGVRGSVDSANAYVMRLGPTGAFHWVTTWGGPSLVTAADVALDNAGMVHITGYFSDTADFDGGSAIQSRTAVGGRDGYVLRLDPTGAYLGVTAWGGPTYDVPESLAVDPTGSAAIAGWFQGTVNFDPDGPGETRTCEGASDSFLLRLDSSGAFAGVATWGGSGAQLANDVALDDEGSARVVGAYLGTTDFDTAGAGGSHTATPYTDAYLLRVDSGGGVDGVFTWGGSGDDTASAVALDAGGTVAVVGTFLGTVDFGLGTAGSRTSLGLGDGFLLRLSGDHIPLWVATWGGPHGDTPRGVALDAAGNAAVVGVFSKTVEFYPGAASSVRSSVGEIDAFLLRLDPSGAFGGVATWGGPENDWAFDVGIDGTGAIAIVGHQWGTTDFDPGPEVEEHTAVAFDGYLLHLLP